MKITLKYTLLITILFLMLGCGSKKSSTTAASKTVDKTVTSTVVKENVSVEIKHFGDTLQGEIPIPTLSKEPVKLVAESAGQRLEIELTDNKATYKSTSKHTATTTINSVKESDNKAVADVVQVQEVRSVNTTKPWRPPWWVYLAVIAVIIGVAYCIQFNLNPISTLIKYIKR